MKKHYQTITLGILLFIEDAVRCSEIFEYGDSIAEDIF